MSGNLKNPALDLLLGGACVACSRPGPALCAACAEAMEQLPREVRPQPCPRGFPRTFAVADYDRATKAALLAHKEHGVLALAKPLGRALALSVFGLMARPIAQGVSIEPIALVPVPSRGPVTRSRGYDPLTAMARAARAALRRSGLVAELAPVLRVARTTTDQAGLDAAARAANLAEAFSARGVRTGRTIVIVDDIVTTGATAVEAARALAAAGVDVAGMAVVAATRRRSP